MDAPLQRCFARQARLCWAWGLLLCTGAGMAAVDAAVDVALVTSVQGKGMRNGTGIEAFSRLRADEEIELGRQAGLQVLYFANGRLESWRGGKDGRLKIGAGGSSASGLQEPGVRQLPPAVVRQIARAPVFDSEGNVVTSRYRSIPTPASIAAVEAEYRKLREGAPQEDLSPELYLLSGMFELQELERVEKTLAELRKERPQDPQVKLLASLYGKAIRDARNVKQ